MKLNSYHYHYYSELENPYVKQWSWNIFKTYKYIRYLKKRGCRTKIKIEHDGLHVYVY